MKYSPFLSFLLFGALPLFCQLDSNSVTVTPSRTVTAALDQLNYALQVCGPLSSTLDEAVSQLQGLGVTSSAFNSVTSQTSGSTSNTVKVQLCWVFSYTAPLAKAKETATALGALKSSISMNNAAWSFGFNIEGLQASPATQSSCAIADLMSDAKARAQKLADAAGMTLGPVLAISGYTGSNPICSMVVKFGLTRF